MLTKGTCIKIVAGSLLAVASLHIARFVVMLGVFSNHFQHYPGPCKKVKNIQPGSEDFSVLSNGLTFITSGFRLQRHMAGVDEHFRVNQIKGRIYLLNLNQTEAGARELKIKSTQQFNVDTFHPHGIGIWEDKKDGRHVVFVVNHPREEPVRDRIEKFVFHPDKLELVHQAYYAGDAMATVNDVQPTGEHSFYFSNFEYFRNTAGVMAETLLQLPWTNVVYYESNKYTSVVDKLSMANGVVMSKDGQYLYVAASLGREIRVYKRNQKTNALFLQQVFPLHTIPDNILVDQVTGDLYVGCHPIGYKVLKHLEEPHLHTTPSQVIHLRVKDGKITSAQELFYDDGNLISGSTSAIVYNKKLLVGSVFNSLVICDCNVPL